MNIVYMPGSELFIADTLNGAFLLHETAPETESCDVLAMKHEEESIKEVDMLEFLPMTSESLVSLREETERDECLQMFKHENSLTRTIQSSRHSRPSSHAMAYRTRCTVITGLSSHQESFKSLQRCGSSNARHRHPITPRQTARSRMLLNLQRGY